MRSPSVRAYAPAFSGHVTRGVTAWSHAPPADRRRADDPRLADYRDLTDVALRRVLEPEGGLYIAESAKVIARAIAAGHRPRSVLVQEKWLDDVTRARRQTRRSTSCRPRSPSRLTGYAVHRGALAAMHRPALPSVADAVAGARLVLVLEDIVDHTNVGAAFRAAAGLGADAVLVTPALRRPPVPPQRPREHGDGVPGAVDAAAGVAGGRRHPARRGPAPRRARPRRGRRARSTSSPPPAPSGSRCCWAPRATASAAVRCRPPTPSSPSRWRAASTRSTSRPPRAVALWELRPRD